MVALEVRNLRDSSTARLTISTSQLLSCFPGRYELFGFIHSHVTVTIYQCWAWELRLWCHLHGKENLRKLVHIVPSSVFEEVVKRVVADHIMRLFLPYASKIVRRISLPQMAGECPAVGVGPWTLILCFC